MSKSKNVDDFFPPLKGKFEAALQKNSISGRQYDKFGNVSPWWSEETISAFDERAQCFVDMYENYTVPELIPILGDDAHVG